MADLLGLLTGGLTAGANVATARNEGRAFRAKNEEVDLLRRLAQDRQDRQDAQSAEMVGLNRQNVLDQIRERNEAKAPAAPRTQYDAERGVMVNLDAGTAAPVQGLPAKPVTALAPSPRNIDPLSPEGIEAAKNRALVLAEHAPPRTSIPTEAERKAAGLYMTGKNGYEVMARLLGVPEDDPATPVREDEAAGKEAPGFFNRQASRIGMGVGNIVSAQDLRQMDQAAYDLSEAWLRLTSGAAIGKDEIANAAKAIIPQPGDDAATRTQKARSRRLRVEALRQAAGRAIDPNAVGTALPGADDLDARINAAIGRQP